MKRIIGTFIVVALSALALVALPNANAEALLPRSVPQVSLSTPEGSGALSSPLSLIPGDQVQRLIDVTVSRDSVLGLEIETQEGTNLALEIQSCIQPWELDPVFENHFQCTQASLLHDQAGDAFLDLGEVSKRRITHLKISTSLPQDSDAAKGGHTFSFIAA